jgi:hypothetical protein
MLTLSYGYKKPQNGDKGQPLFDALADDIQRVNDHTHDGVNSPPLTAQSLQGIQATIPAASWAAYGPTGHYRQLVTMVSGFNYDTCFMSFRLTTGEYVTPTVEKFSATQYYVYTTDNTKDFVVTYGG